MGLSYASEVTALLVALALAVAPPPLAHRTFRFVDHSRVADFRNGTSGPRVLVTYVRYPRDRRGPLPLIVFAHGFSLTPGVYAPLLDAWARAGYVVAAPLFPVEERYAPGGPSESDLVNEPGDLRFVITRLLAVPGLVDPRRIAVAGHSDGAEAAEGVAYDTRYRDRRLRAALIFSGAELPGPAADRFPLGSPPLLAVQGTADSINAPKYMLRLYRDARRPKQLLLLHGASHLPPYTTNRRERALVERTSIAFLNRYLSR